MGLSCVAVVLECLSFPCVARSRLNTMLGPFS